MAPLVVNIRCPSCHRLGAFPGFQSVSDAQLNEIERDSAGRGQLKRALNYGVRACPNPECGEPLFVITIPAVGRVLATFPVERIDFDASKIPARILSSFTEAIICHANACFKAAAIMVRRTLEEMCQDRGATGDNLKKRIESLGSKVVLPKELLEAADELRLLGNDAAHLESKDYDEVGKDEVEAGIELCKELLKAVYQLEGLVERLRKLKKPAS